MIVAGEISGDMHAARLVTEIKKFNPHISFSGLGGPRLKECGVELYADLTSLAVIGFVEVLKNYREFKRIFHSFLEKVKSVSPDCVILVDYPGFNLPLAKELKKLNRKVFYYISPQVWAWHENRVQSVKKYVDKMFVLFQFEKDFYLKHGINVEFVGHPLLETIKTQQTKEEFLKTIGLTPDKLTIGLLPGSREKEVERILPVMLSAAQFIHSQNPNTQFLIPRAVTVSELLLNQTQFNDPGCLPIRIVSNQIYECISACDLCMVASGTATLETAILGKPMVVVYKTSFLTWALARWLIKIPYIGMANVIAGKTIVPECIQFAATGRNIANQILAMINDETKITQIKSELDKVKQSLGSPGASHRTACEILKELS